MNYLPQPLRSFPGINQSQTTSGQRAGLEPCHAWLLLGGKDVAV